jgi:hypothetical protein
MSDQDEERQRFKELRNAHDEYCNCGGKLSFVKWIIAIGGLNIEGKQ